MTVFLLSAKPSLPGLPEATKVSSRYLFPIPIIEQEGTIKSKSISFPHQLYASPPPHGAYQSQPLCYLLTTAVQTNDCPFFYPKAPLMPQLFRLLFRKGYHMVPQTTTTSFQSLNHHAESPLRLPLGFPAYTTNQNNNTIHNARRSDKQEKQYYQGYLYLSQTNPLLRLTIQSKLRKKVHEYPYKPTKQKHPDKNELSVFG